MNYFQSSSGQQRQSFSSLFAEEDVQSAYMNLLQDMSEDKRKTENQRKAMFNILKDVHASQKQLEEKYTYIKTMRSLLERLSVTVDIHEMMNASYGAFLALLPFDALHFLIPDYYGSETSYALYTYAREGCELGEKYFNVLLKNMSDFTSSLPEKVGNKNILLSQLNGGCYNDLISGTYKTRSENAPVNTVTIPLYSHSKEGVLKAMGLVCFSVCSQESEEFSVEMLRIAEDLTNAIAMNFERVQTLIASEHSRVSDLVSSMSNGVLMFDLGQHVLVENPVIQKLFEHREYSNALQDFFALFKDEQVEGDDKKEPVIGHLSRAVIRVLDSGKSVKLPEIPLRGRIYEVMMNPVKDHKQKITGGVIIMHDITHLKEVDKMKTEFVSLASHQLRTPLSAIRWFLEMLQKGRVGKMNEKQLDVVNDAHECANRMTRLVNGLLNVSRLEQGRLTINPKPIDIVDLTNGIVKEHTAKLESKHQSVQVQSSKDIPNISLDEQLVRQVFMNLLSNAVNYSPDGGVIEISITKDEKWCTWVIADSGVGIPMAEQKNIFRKFYRAENVAKKYTEGTGLGLYLAKQIIEQSGGTIGFSSKENEGTTFTVQIPLRGSTPRKGERGLA